MERLPAMAVRALRRHDDHRPWRRSGLGGRHALDRLVHVLVQRIPAIAGDDDVRRRHLDLTLAAHKLAASRVRGKRIAGKSLDDLLAAVDDDVDDERQACLAGGPHHVAMHRIAVQNPSPGLRRGDEFGAVIGQYRRFPGNTRQNALAPPGKSRKEMRLDKALCQEQVSLNSDSVDP